MRAMLSGPREAVSYTHLAYLHVGFTEAGARPPLGTRSTRTMSPDLLVQLCGLHSFAFALFHLAFWKLFHWKRELQKVGLPTRAITQILNLRLIYLFAGIGVLCFAFTQELHTTALGRACLLYTSRCV